MGGRLVAIENAGGGEAVSGGFQAADELAGAPRRADEPLDALGGMPLGIEARDHEERIEWIEGIDRPVRQDRKSTRLNSSHQIISYAVFCLKKKKKSMTVY